MIVLDSVLRYAVMGLALIAAIRGIAWIWAIVSAVQGTAGKVDFGPIGPELNKAAVLCGAALLVVLIVLGVF